MIVEPSRPEGPLDINDVTGDSVCLSWKPPQEDNGGPIQGYVIEAKDVSQMDVRKKYFWSEGQRTSYIVAGLETSHIYQFRVYAQNEAGRGEGLLNKTLVRVKLKSRKPPKPTRPLAEVKGDDSVFLEWAVKGDFEGLSYVIERSAPQSELWLQCNRGVVLTTSYLVTGLLPGQEYRFRVSSENANGVSVPSEESDVICLGSVEGEPPSVTLPLKDCFIKSGESASFICEYSGTPSISADWTKDNIRVRTGYGSTISTTDNKSELKISEVESDDDDSDIRCTLRNEHGHASSEAKIKLFSPPEIRCPSSYREGLTYDIGESVRLKVTFSGKPLPKITVFLNEIEISSSDRREFVIQPESIEIRIQDLCGEDSGVYKFIALNVLGKEELEVAVKVSGPPKPPDGIPTLEYIENEIIINWPVPLEDGGSEVFNYIIEKKHPEMSTWTRFESTHKTTLMLGSVHDIDGCSFRVKAENIYGISEPSLETQVSKKIFQTSIPSSTVESELNIKLLNPTEQGKTTLFNAFRKSEERLSSEFPRAEKEFEHLCGLESNTQELNANHPNLQLAVTQELDAPTSVLFAATQTLLSPMILNFACNCTEVFCETFSFSTEAPPELEYLTASYENPKIHVPCEVSIDFEFVNTFLFSNNPAETGTYCWVPNVHFLSVYQPEMWVPFVCETEDIDYIECDNHSLKSTNYWMLYDESWQEMDSPNKVYISEQCNSAHHKYCGCNSILVVFAPPLVLESLNHFPIYELNSLITNGQLSFESCNSLTISFCHPYEMVSILQITNPVKSTLTTYSTHDYEELISISSVPVSNCKPALSVLPLVRDTNSLTVNLGLKDTIISSDLKKNVDLTCESVNIPNPDEIVSKSPVSYKMEGFQKPWEKMNNVSDTELEHLSVEDVTWKCPDWLKSVSPSYIPEIEPDSGELSETLLDLEALDADERTPDQPLSAFKEKSVEELLQLAQEVEKRFTQKTEQIQSLENILQTELFSLEKDLATVSEIHKNLRESPVILESGGGASNSVDFHDENRHFGKDLIDFVEEVPSSKRSWSEPSHYAPEVVVHLQNRVIQTGCRTRLYCSITGDPEPDVEWRKNGKTIPQSSRYYCSNLVEFGQFLDVYNAKSTDSGLYSCVATNPLGTTQTQAYLRVIGKREISPVEPAFISSPEDVSALIGETIALEWKITGTPSPHVIWFKNAEKIETDLHVSTFSNHRGCCRITLHSVDVSDSAIYTCYLENEAGSAVSTVLLTVSDEFSSQPLNPAVIPTFCAKDLVCKENYHKNYQNRSQESINEKDTLPSRLTREKKASAMMDSSVPGPPFAPRILSVGQGSVILCWSAPITNGFDRELEYLVEKRLLHSTHWNEVGTTRATVYTAHGLAGGKSYVFRISAKNRNGKGLPVTMQEPVHFAVK